MSTLDPAVEDLDPHLCWELLRTSAIGRLAIVVRGRPDIFPVNYVVDHGTVVFRSAAGTKLSGLHDDTAAAFEVDGHHVDDSYAWSVVIHGQLEPLTSFDPVTTHELALYPLQAGAKPRFVRVVPHDVTGRRFHTTDPATWATPAGSGRRQAWE